MFNNKSIVLLIALAITNYANADLTTGLVAHYPFNGNANDASGNGNNGTVYGATLTADRFGNADSAYSFNGSSYIQIEHSQSLNLASAITISAWIKTTLTGRGGIIAKWDGGLTSDAPQAYWMMAFEGKNGASVNAYDNEADNTYTGNRLINNNLWTHISFTADNASKEIMIYTNGDMERNANISGNIIKQTSSRVLIGVNDIIYDHGWFIGSIDDVRIYNRALSESEIQQLYSEGSTQQLTITKQGTGSGTVTSKPAGIDCAGGADQVCITIYPPPAGCQCSAAFPTGTAVTLTATPDTIYCITTPCPVNTWVGWGKDCAGTANTCTVNMTADKTATATFNVASKPDFTIPVMTISPATPVTNGTFTATVTVKNQGTVAADGGQLRLWANQPTAPVCAATGGNKNVAVGTLAAGASKTFTITGVGAGAGGFKTLRAFVDATCVSAESNETNNQRTLSYRVAGRLPDLTITNIAITPATPAKNTVFNAAITVKNQGVIATLASYLDVWTNQATPQTCGAIGNAWVEVGALAAGASKVITLPVASGVAGSKTLRAFVDSWCEILESNETNNQMIKTYSVQ